MINYVSLNFRHEANQAKKGIKIRNKSKTSAVKIRNKAGKNTFNKGKNFGGPRFQKKDKNSKKKK